MTLPLPPAPNPVGAAGAGYRPVPSLTIDGVTISGTTTSPPTSQVLLDGISVHWGRTDALAQPEVATATAALFDASGTWATSTDRVGLPAVLSWSVPVFGGTSTTVFFRGRVASITPARRRLGGVDGVLVTLRLTGILGDLANRTPVESWPAETLDQRRARIATAAAAVLPGGVAIRASWAAAPVAAVPLANQKSLLEHLHALYDSCGADRMSYRPDVQSVIPIPRRAYPDRGIAQLWWNVPGDAATGATQRDNAGAYARAMPLIPAGFSGITTPNYLDGRRIEYDPADGVTRDLASRITRVQVSWTDAAGAQQIAELLVPEANEALIGIRAATLDSLTTDGTFAATSAAELRTAATSEGAAWRLKDPRTLPSFPFESFAQVVALLYGTEDMGAVFLQGTWLPALGIRPVYGVIGATLDYSATDGGWALTLALSPVVTAAQQHAIAWDEIDNGSTTYQLEWHDDPDPRGLHDSLTYEDIGHVAAGLGMQAVPADRGWDR